MPSWLVHGQAPDAKGLHPRQGTRGMPVVDNANAVTHVPSSSCTGCTAPIKAGQRARHATAEPSSGTWCHRCAAGACDFLERFTRPLALGA